MLLDQDTALEPRSYLLPEGIEIAANGITLDGGGATLVGAGRAGAGIRLHARQGVTIKNLAIVEYRQGIDASGCEDLTLQDLRISSTEETPPNTIFLNIFHSTGALPGAVVLQDCRSVRALACDVSHQLAGLLAYGCSRLTVSGCNANYCSGFGFYLSETSDSRIVNNHADFCCRWHVRDGGGGHMGADAAGFVIVNGSSRNEFTGNFARLGGDGFFLAGLTHDLVHAPCNDNIFTRNDASWSPNIGFEATFSSGNVFRENLANRCNYGFWLGFSRANRLEGNQIQHNLQAGVAVENGIEMRVVGNRLTGNGHGLLLWSKRIPQFDAAVPENDTSRDWQIEENEFTANTKAVRIAADQDHGIRPHLQNGACPPPRNHHLANNLFARNGKDVELDNAS